jgi:membrane protease YdiL (CAAX protease family)
MKVLLGILGTVLAVAALFGCLTLAYGLFHSPAELNETVGQYWAGVIFVALLTAALAWGAFFAFRKALRLSRPLEAATFAPQWPPLSPHNGRRWPPQQ